MMQAASASPASRALTASRSPPTWSPCLVTITSKRRTVNDVPGSSPSPARWASGSSVDWGESTAPVATVRPASWAMSVMSRSARTSTTDVRS